MARKKSIPKFPPTVKGWWEYPDGETNVHYMPICQARRGPFVEWDFIKTSKTPVPITSGKLLQLHHPEAPSAHVGYVNVLSDGSLEFIGLDGNFHFPSTQKHRLKFYNVLGLVKLPQEMPRLLIEHRYSEARKWTMPEHWQEQSFLAKYEKKVG